MNSPSSNPINRRQFIAGTAVAGAGILAAGSLAAAPGSGRKRYALVGTGSRSGMFREAVLKTFAEHSEMVGYCDLNEGRLKLAQAQAKEAGANVPIFLAKDFDRMIRETKPEIVIVTTRDATHDHYITRTLEFGCDV